MDIAALSMAVASSKVNASASVAVASKVKEIAEQNGANLVEMMKSTNVSGNGVLPHVGGSIDLKL
jgi:hypothetical protein